MMLDLDVILAKLTPAELALLRLGAWDDASRWLGHTALEFVPDETTRGYLLHVSECVAEEGARRYRERAGFTVA